MVENAPKERKAIFERSLANFISTVVDRIKEPKKSEYLEKIKEIRSKVHDLYGKEDLEEKVEVTELLAYLEEYEALFQKAAPEIAKNAGVSKETIIQNFTTKFYDPIMKDLDPIMKDLGLEPKAPKNKTSAKKEEEAIDEPQSEKRPASTTLEQNQRKVEEFVEVFIKICGKGNEEKNKQTI